MTEVEVSITVNGAGRTLRIDPRMSLLDLLRERLGLAFIRLDAFQRGYCTPGRLCSAAGLLTEPGLSSITDDLTANPPLTPGEIRERMSGKPCRCGGFVRRDLPITPAKLVE
jgi:aerobic-type carbon monoxide dehydrogenase small subunit (CoxS/CutS family)